MNLQQVDNEIKHVWYPTLKCHSAQTNSKFKKATCRLLNMRNVEHTQMTITR